MFVTKMRGTTYLVFPHSTVVIAFNKTLNKGIEIEHLIRSENGITGGICIRRISKILLIFLSISFGGRCNVFNILFICGLFNGRRQ